MAPDPPGRAARRGNGLAAKWVMYGGLVGLVVIVLVEVESFGSIAPAAVIVAFSAPWLFVVWWALRVLHWLKNIHHELHVQNQMRIRDAHDETV